MKFILFHNGIDWCIYPNGRLIGSKRESSFILYEFWITNPPPHDSKDHALFVAVCEFAVAQGILRPLRVYAIKE